MSQIPEISTIPTEEGIYRTYPPLHKFLIEHEPQYNALIQEAKDFESTSLADYTAFVDEKIVPMYTLVSNKYAESLKYDPTGRMGYGHSEFPYYSGASAFLLQTLDPILEKCSDIYYANEDNGHTAQWLIESYKQVLERSIFNEDILLRYSEFALSIYGVEGVAVTQRLYNLYLHNVSAILPEEYLSTTNEIRSFEIGVGGNVGLPYESGQVLGRLAHLATMTKYEDPAIRESYLDFVLDSLAYYPYGSLTQISKLVEFCGPNVSVPLLLTKLTSENEQVRRFSAELLFRFELGELEVDQGQVGIYGKMFRLLTEEGQSHIIDSLGSVRRLDPNGRWLGLDNNGKALGHFTITAEDLLSTDPTKKLDLDVEKLLFEACIRRADETPSDKELRRAVFNEYLNSLSTTVDALHEKTGVWLNSMDISEQAFFMHTYSKTREPGKREAIDDVIKTYGERALKVFVTMEYGESGESLIEFLQDTGIDERAKDSLLQNYYEMSVRATQIRSLFEKGEKAIQTNFAAEVYEAFIRKTSEFYRAAMLVAQGKAGDITMEELLSNMQQINLSLHLLEKFSLNPQSFSLIGTPQYRNEYLSEDGKTIAEKGSSTWEFADAEGNKLIASIRPRRTFRVDNNFGGEARINFRFQNKSGLETRIALDISDYKETPVVSLDLGVGKPDRTKGIYPSDRIAGVLEVVEGSEGGHNEASFSIQSARQFSFAANALEKYLQDTYQQEELEEITTLAPSL